MRETCLECVVKHLGQAAVTYMETKLGYPEHLLLTVGHLAEASEECDEHFPELAEVIRDHRKALQLNPAHDIPYFGLWDYVKILEAATEGDVGIPDIPEELQADLSE